MTMPKPARRFPPPSPLLIGVFATVVAAVLSVYLFQPSTVGATADPAPGTPTTPVLDTPGSPYPQAVEPPPGSELAIVESGSTPMRDLVGDHMLSWGVVVENPSATLHVSGTVTMTATVDGVEDPVSVQLAFLAPGAKTAIGDTSYVADGTVSDVDFAVTGVQWSDTRGMSYAATATGIEGTWVDVGETENYWSSDGISFPVNERGDLNLNFRVESSHDVLARNTVYTALFRDRDGEIVGAYSDAFGVDVIPPGWSTRQFRVQYGPPESTVAQGIEVYVQVR
ncbi:MAG TPA: hypothetical protein VGF17_21635 [Phytomonospora sp.]